MKIQGDEISGYESSMGRKFRHENTIYVNEIYEYSIDPKLDSNFTAQKKLRMLCYCYHSIMLAKSASE